MTQSLRHLDDPVYDEASSSQPNYSSLGPAYDMETENDEVTNGYDTIQWPLGTADTPQFKAANHTPVRMEAGEDDFYDTEEHTYAVVNKKKKTKKKLSSNTADNEEQTADVQDAPANPTLVTNEGSKKEDDFYDVEEHTYSVVNVKHKKKSNKKKAVNGEGEEEENL